MARSADEGDLAGTDAGVQPLIVRPYPRVDQEDTDRLTDAAFSGDAAQPKVQERRMGAGRLLETVEHEQRNPRGEILRSFGEIAGRPTPDHERSCAYSVRRAASGLRGDLDGVTWFTSNR